MNEFQGTRATFTPDFVGPDVTTGILEIVTPTGKHEFPVSRSVGDEDQREADILAYTVFCARIINEAVFPRTVVVQDII